MRLIKMFLLSILGMALSCSGTRGSVGGTETGNTVGAAVASLFGTDEDSAALERKVSFPSRLAALLIREARAQMNGQRSACDVRSGDASGIEMGQTVEPGTYGVSDSPGDFVILTTANGCDQGGDYATFQVLSHSMICTTSEGAVSTVTMTDSTGVFRETGTASDIYGIFNISAGDGAAVAVSCHFTITHSDMSRDSNFSVAVCVDASGTSVEQTGDTTCMDD